MNSIKHKILVMSGKGGVGKSTVAANLAAFVSGRGKTAGLLDVDIHGPSIPKLLGLECGQIPFKSGKIIPVRTESGLEVMSIGFLLDSDDSALIWRGPMKMGVIKQFVEDVSWGNPEYLIVDLPPGTGDEALSVCQLIKRVDGSLIITTPQDLALLDVRKSVDFCRKMKIPVIGVIENMSGFTCPSCGETTYIFKKGGAKKMCRDMGLKFLGSLPLSPRVVERSDDGKTAQDSSSESDFSRKMERIFSGILADLNGSPRKQK